MQKLTGDRFAAAARRALAGTALTLGLLAAPVLVNAQTATIHGVLSGFDINNDTGQEAHGFEIELEGAAESDLFVPGFGERYGAATFVPYAGGILVRWVSPYDAATGTYSKRTLPRQGAQTFAWNDCYLFGSTYNNSGCEHFAQALRSSIVGKTVKITGRWLVKHPTNPGTLIAAEPNVGIPFPTWTVQPPLQGGAAPVVVAKVDPPELFADAQWVKIFKANLTRPLTAEELASNNPIVPLDPADVEVAWDILQAEPASGCNGNCGQKQNSGSINADTRAVIRRYETYKYTGAYDALTHEVACADGTCTAPSDGELGLIIGAQNSAVNIEGDTITVVRTGNGTVRGDRINCGSSCSEFALRGSLVALEARPGSGSVFSGWSGACSGAQTICSVTVNGGAINVGATFTTPPSGGGGGGGGGGGTTNPTLTVKAQGGKGLITSNVGGINCGRTCTASIARGTAVTVTAVPEPGFSFVNFTGGCTGTATSCTITVNSSRSVQANFTR